NRYLFQNKATTISLNNFFRKLVFDLIGLFQLKRFKFFLQRMLFFQKTFRNGHNVFRVFEKIFQFAQNVKFMSNETLCLLCCNRFYSSYTRCHRALRDDLEKTDLSCCRNVGTTTKLY